ncbi:hypothetical protein P171DRAFT_488273 [Karstenula rhodostoma CBS 690.94]|uniref:Uncharacterized protein n=1 Tax=Karstenula rhodostoma CBS 690.94 TaxID=1392251 RepID=A0A9P4PCZ9_9PLEO|nr:hypothetical protein P171DRAFT_488273 [Karstenula rhodostoma CBS 690.94]
MIYHHAWDHCALRYQRDCFSRPVLQISVQVDYSEPEPTYTPELEQSHFPMWYRANARLRHEALEQFYHCAEFTVTFPDEWFFDLHHPAPVYRWYPEIMGPEIPDIQRAQNLLLKSVRVHYPWLINLGEPRNSNQLSSTLRLLRSLHALRNLQIQFRGPNYLLVLP